MNIDLKITASVKKQIAEAGFSPKYGARPLRRKIQEKIENPLSDMILNGELREGDEITVRVLTGEITFATSQK
jgi:ATP-dependent Clp protease ATP-binding subunit ClpC